MKSLTIQKANLLYLASMLLVITLGTWFQSLSFSLGLLLTEVICILLPSLWILRKNRVSFETIKIFSHSRGSLLLVNFVLGMGTWMTGVLIESLVVQLSGYQASSTNLVLPENWTQAIMLYLGLAIAAPLCEEVLFRGILQNSYQKIFRAPIAIIIVAILFSLFHLCLQGLPALIPVALVLGFTYWRTGSLWNSIVVHFANNFMAAIVIIQSGLFPTIQLPLFNGPQLILGVLLLAAGLVLLVRLVPPPAPLPTAPGHVRFQWRNNWPILMAVILYLIFAGIEWINRVPYTTLPLQPVDLPSPLRLEYELLDKSGKLRGSVYCQLESEGETQSLHCERDNEAFELKEGNNYFSAQEGTMELIVQWALENRNLQYLQAISTYPEFKMKWEITGKQDDLMLQVSAGSSPEQSLQFSENTLVAEEWPFRLMGLPFQNGTSWITRYLDPMTWREKTRDSGLVITNNMQLLRSSETVKVPAGTFTAWKLQLSDGQAAWYDQNAPHIPIFISLGMFDYQLLSIE